MSAGYITPTQHTLTIWIVSTIAPTTQVSLTTLIPSNSVNTAYSFFPHEKKAFGRDEDVINIVEDLATGRSPVTILGPPGMGKSSIAASVLYHPKTVAHFGPRRHWASFNDVHTPDLFQTIIINALSIQANGTRIPGEQAAGFFKFSKNRTAPVINALYNLETPRLIVLDDLDSIWDAERDAVQDVIDQLLKIPDIVLLVTLQGSTHLPPTDRTYQPATLSLYGSKLIFLAIYPYTDPGLDELLKQLDFLPLAIVLVARACLMHNLKPSELLTRWKASHGAALLLEDAAWQRRIGTSIERARSQSAGDGTKLLRILSMLPGGVLPQDLSSMVLSMPNLDEVTGILTNLSLASTTNEKRLSLISPIRNHVAKYHHLDETSRNGIYFYHFRMAEEGLRRPSDALFASSMKKLIQHQRNIEAVLVDALENRCHAAVEATIHYTSPRCAIKPRIDILEKAVMIALEDEESKCVADAMEDGSMLLAARALQRLGELMIISGKYRFDADSPFFHRFRDLFSEPIARFKMLGDEVAIEHCNFHVAHVIWINDTRGGIRHLKGTRNRFKQLGDLEGVAKCERKLAENYLDEANEVPDRLGQAVEACKRASRFPDPHNQALCQVLFGRIHAMSNNLESARERLETAAATLHSFGDRSSAAECHNLLGFTLLRLGRQDDTRKQWKHALKEFDLLGEELKAAFLRRHLAKISPFEEAIELYQQAIPAFWKSAFTFAGAETRFDLAMEYVGQGNYNDALLHLEICRPQMIANITPHLASNALFWIIRCLLRVGQTDRARLVLENNKVEAENFAKKYMRPSSKPLEAGESVALRIVGGELDVQVGVVKGEGINVPSQPAKGEGVVEEQEECNHPEFKEGYNPIYIKLAKDQRTVVLVHILLRR